MFEAPDQLDTDNTDTEAPRLMRTWYAHDEETVWEYIAATKLLDLGLIVTNQYVLGDDGLQVLEYQINVYTDTPVNLKTE